MDIWDHLYFNGDFCTINSIKIIVLMNKPVRKGLVFCEMNLIKMNKWVTICLF